MYTSSYLILLNDCNETILIYFVELNVSQSTLEHSMYLKSIKRNLKMLSRIYTLTFIFSYSFQLYFVRIFIILLVLRTNTINFICKVHFVLNSSDTAKLLLLELTVESFLCDISNVFDTQYCINDISQIRYIAGVETHQIKPHCTNTDTACAIRPETP